MQWEILPNRLEVVQCDLDSEVLVVMVWPACHHEDQQVSLVCHQQIALVHSGGCSASSLQTPVITVHSKFNSDLNGVAQVGEPENELICEFFATVIASSSGLCEP